MSEQLEFNFSIVRGKLPKKVPKVISFRSHKFQREKRQQELLLRKIVEAASKNPLYK